MSKPVPLHFRQQLLKVRQVHGLDEVLVEPRLARALAIRLLPLASRFASAIRRSVEEPTLRAEGETVAH